MLRLSLALSARTHGWLRYAPTNLLAAAIRTRRGLKWGMAAMLLSAPYLYAAAICTAIIGNGRPGWLTIWPSCSSGTPSRCSGLGPQTSRSSSLFGRENGGLAAPLRHVEQPRARSRSADQAT
ncbi:MAG: hypothetical protein ACK5MT_20705 [Actinomycetales bacterium]